MNSPFILVIFGATGDLMYRKLMPGLYKLIAEKELDSPIFIVGVGRRKIFKDEFAAMMEEAVKDSVKEKFDPTIWQNILSGLDYQQGFFEENKLYSDLVTLVEQFDKKLNACIPRFFYLATPPEHYEDILTRLQGSKLAEGCGQGTPKYTRLLIEKPFGKDLATAQALEKLLSSIFEERQIYRIDHYLGKETVQNLLAFRFANGIFEPTWNNQFIDHIQIHLAEEEGVGNRGAFYDGVGALRDVVQNHMLQMLALTAMEQPRAFDPSSIRDERARVLKSIIAIEPNDAAKNVVRGQYEGYLKEKDVDPASTTETFVSLRLMLEGKRWQGVPFYLRTGKKLTRQETEISIHYKKPVVCYGDVCLFDEAKVLRNVLSIRIQPDDSINLRLMTKKPGFGMELTQTFMNFRYREAFPDFNSPDAYERLLLDAIRGDQTLFARSDAIEASWAFVTKILEGWEKQTLPLPVYKPGTWGPAESEALIEKDKRHWYNT